MKLMVKNIDDKTIKKLAHEYLSGYYVSLKNLATKYRTTATTISNILWRGIAENIIDSKVADYIYRKVVDKPSIGWYQRKLRWDEAFEKREKKIHKAERDYEAQLELNNLYALKESYENMISSYENFFFYEADAPSLEELGNKLDEINKKISSLS